MAFVVVGGMLLASPAALAGTPPSNDSFAQAKVVSSLPYGDTVNAGAATQVASDPKCGPFTTGHTVWYAFTPGENVRLDARATAKDSSSLAVGVYSGNLGSLVEVGCDTGNEFAGPRVDLTAGTT